MATVSIQFVRRLPRGKCKEHDVIFIFYILYFGIGHPGILIIGCPDLIRFHRLLVLEVSKMYFQTTSPSQSTAMTRSCKSAGDL